MGVMKRQLFDQMEREASEPPEAPEPTDAEWKAFEEREERMMREYEIQCGRGKSEITDQRGKND